MRKPFDTKNLNDNNVREKTLEEIKELQTD